MTVADLIKELEVLPQEYEVCIAEGSINEVIIKEYKVYKTGIVHRYIMVCVD